MGNTPEMAARRLIIVLLALMGISTLAAVLAPPIEEREGSSTSETTEATAPGDQAPAGVLLKERIDAYGGPPARIGAVSGDRLALTIASPQPTGVAVSALGLSGFADRGAPARFDVVLREPGRYLVAREDGATIAKIEVADPSQSSDG